MAEETAKEIVLKCVNALALLPEETTTTVKQLSDGKFFSCLIGKLTNEDIASGETDKIVGILKSLLKEHFAGPKLINFEDVVTGNELELTKLTLLLLYITFVSCAKLNNRLIHSPLLTTVIQSKLKYLIESIQKRGSGMSSKFLHILCQEKLENRSTARCYTPVESVAPWGSLGSPHVYSTSPKSASGSSPLRELVQSPPFRMQRLLNAKVLEAKKLQQKIHSVENDKQELEMQFESSQKKASKLTDALSRCQDDLKEQRRLRDELEARLSSGEDLVQQQVQRVSRELSAIRKENSSLEDTLHRVLADNDELTTKNKSLHTRLTLTSAERDTLEEELSTLSRAKLENDSLIDDQAAQIFEFKAQLEELHQCLLESNRSGNRTIEESFEYGSPMNFSGVTSPPHAGSGTENTSGENMADVFIDKILTETREKLTQLQEKHASLEEQYAALQNQLKEVTTSRDQLHSKVAVLESEKKIMLQEKDEHGSAFSALTAEHESQKTALVNARHELEEILAQEQASTGEIIKAQEEALNALKEEVETTLKIHASEKANLQKEMEHKQSEVDLLKKEMEDHMIKCDELTSSLNNQIKEKDTLLHNSQEEMERYIAEANEEKTNLTIALQAKEDSYHNIKLEMESTIASLKEENKEIVETVKHLEHSLEELSAEAVLYKAKNGELTEKIDILEKSVTTKKAEYERELSKVQDESKSTMSNLNNNLAEKSTVLEALQREICQMAENHRLELAQLNAAMNQEKQCNESLQQDLEKNKEGSLLKIQSLNIEIANIKTKLSCFEETLNEKEGTFEKNVETLMAEKKELEMSSKSTIEELKKCENEKTQIIENLKKELEESQARLKADLEEAQQQLLEKEESAKMLESNKDGIILDLQNKITCLNAELASMKRHVTSENKIYQANLDELKVAQQEAKKYVAQVRGLEAKLIDLEKSVTAAKEETMRVEREHERSTRSLTEELQATKEKYRAERQTAVEKMKATFTTEVQKLMIDIEEQEQELKNGKIFQHKYEIAKKKLADTLTELNESKTSREHYQTQMAKYKEHMSKLTDNLKKEQARNGELSEMHQPLKDKLKEAELTIKRLDNEKRSLEVQVRLADSQLRDLKRQQDFENLNARTSRASEMRPKTRASISESQLLKVTVSRPSSSTDDDLSGNDSAQKLLGNKLQRTRNRPKTISRAASAETVFRKPEAQTLTSNSRQRSVNVANLAASSSARTRKETATLEKSSSKKSLGQSVPRDMLFSCEDEEELFSNKYLLDMQVGRCNPMDDAQWKRLSELQRRNSLYPPHMRSAYPAEMQFAPLEDFEDDKLRDGCAVDERHLLNLTEATENLVLDSPAFNLRKRKSLSDSEVSIGSIGSKKNKRLSTSYSRPGPPTPGRRSTNRGDKENRYDPDDSLVSTSSKESKQGSAISGGSPGATRSRYHLKDSTRAINSPSSSLNNSSRGPGARSKRSTLSPGGASFISKKGLNITPRGKKGMTPSSLRKMLSRGKSPWRKLENDQEVTRKRTRPEQLISRIHRTLRNDR